MSNKQDTTCCKICRKIVAIPDRFSLIFRKKYERIYFRKLRRKLNNKNFSLFSDNCYAGIIYHRLGLQFQSPTINLFFPSKKEYLRFIMDIPYYLSIELKETTDSQYPCPMGIIDDVRIVFNHNKSFSEAKELWDRRKERVNYDNIYVIFDDIGDADYDDLVAFNSLEYKGKVILTAKEYDRLENIVQIKKYKKNQTMRLYLLERSKWTGKCPADRDFDFVSWLNNDN